MNLTVYVYKEVTQSIQPLDRVTSQLFQIQVSLALPPFRQSEKLYVNHPPLLKLGWR